MKKTNLVTLLIVTIMLAGGLCAQPVMQTNAQRMTEAPVFPHAMAGFDAENITIVLVSPANQSTLEGTVDLNVTITSVNGPLNLTLFVDGDIYYSDYNNSEIVPGSMNITIDTTILPEGLLNFTILLVDYTPGSIDKESYYMIFTVDNYGVPNVEILSPESDSTFTGLDDIELNITSEYSEVFMNITVDDEITSEFNATTVPVGAGNFSINGSRYENGQHVIDITVYTEEGLSDTASITLIFLDHIRFYINDLAEFAKIQGVTEFDITIETPYDIITIDSYVDGILDSSNEYQNTNESVFISLNTSEYSEGEHNFTFIASDEYDHSWTRTWVFEIDNHGVPEVELISPSDDVVVGMAEFTINIESTWDSVSVLVYVDDDELVGNYTDVAPGEFTFFFDTNTFSKWEHTLKVVVETEEGESAEIEETFGFANIKIEEIISLVVLAGLAVAIPLTRKRGGQPIRPVLILDIVYLAVIAAGFLVLGITTLNYAIWHFNLGSIWILGSILVILNWIFPLLKEE